MADGKRFTCYTEKDEYGDDTIVLNDEYIGHRPVDKELIGWYGKSSICTYFSECKTVAILSKEELEEYLKNIKR